MGVVIGVTATKGGVGKSLMAPAIAAASVRLGQKTVLADLEAGNPDQAQRSRESLSFVPARMPTVMDDAWPSQWWEDPDSGVTLVPGARSSGERTEVALMTAATRLVERARNAFDVVVLDMHQILTTPLTKALVELCDVLVPVFGQLRESQTHLGEWLPKATDPNCDEPFMPYIDAEAIRLVYSEATPRPSDVSDNEFATAHAEVGTTWKCVGKFWHDEQMAAAAQRGAVLGAMSDESQAEALKVAAALLGIRIDLPSASPPRRWWQRKPRLGSPFQRVRPVAPLGGIREVGVLPPPPVPTTAPVTPSAPTATTEVPGARAVLYGPPVVRSGDVPLVLDDAEVAALVAVSLLDQVPVVELADMVGASESQVRTLAARGLLKMSGRSVTRPLEVTTDLMQITAASDRLAEAMSPPAAAGPVRDDLVEAFAIGFQVLAEVDGWVLAVDQSTRPWRWLSDFPAARAELVRELETLVVQLAAAYEQLLVGGFGAPAEPKVFVDRIGEVAARLSRVADPTPLVAAMLRIAHSAGDRGLIEQCRSLLGAVDTSDPSGVLDAVLPVSTLPPPPAPSEPGVHPAPPPSPPPVMESGSDGSTKFAAPAVTRTTSQPVPPPTPAHAEEPVFGWEHQRTSDTPAIGHHLKLFEPAGCRLVGPVKVKPVELRVLSALVVSGSTSPAALAARFSIEPETLKNQARPLRQSDPPLLEVADGVWSAVVESDLADLQSAAAQVRAATGDATRAAGLGVLNAALAAVSGPPWGAAATSEKGVWTWASERLDEFEALTPVEMASNIVVDAVKALCAGVEHLGHRAAGPSAQQLVDTILGVEEALGLVDPSELLAAAWSMAISQRDLDRVRHVTQLRIDAGDIVDEDLLAAMTPNDD